MGRAVADALGRTPDVMDDEYRAAAEAAKAVGIAAADVIRGRAAGRCASLRSSWSPLAREVKAG